MIWTGHGLNQSFLSQVLWTHTSTYGTQGECRERVHDKGYSCLYILHLSFLISRDTRKPTVALSAVGEWKDSLTYQSVYLICNICTFIYCLVLFYHISSIIAGASQVKWNRRNHYCLASSHDGDVRIWDKRVIMLLAASWFYKHGLNQLIIICLLVNLSAYRWFCALETQHCNGVCSCPPVKDSWFGLASW